MSDGALLPFENILFFLTEERLSTKYWYKGGLDFSILSIKQIYKRPPPIKKKTPLEGGKGVTNSYITVICHIIL